MTIQRDKIFTRNGEAVFIIGNGFDIDLGLPSSYSEFAESEYWPFKNIVNITNSTPFNLNHRSLHNTLHNAALESNWFDIEYLLTKYATLDGTYTSKHVISSKILEDAKSDKSTFNMLCQSLSDYLKHIQTTQLNDSSVAAQVLRVIIDSRYFNYIFSFNYTDLKLLAKNIGIERDFWYTHMHGDLENGIILGIESQVEFMPPYRYLCKEYNMNYRTRFLNYALQEANEIVIFGHSLSPIDYHYFQQLFAQQSREDMQYSDRKKITIFTRNEETKRDICDQLRKMNNKRLDLLYGMNIFHILRTDGSDEKEIAEFFKSVEIRSKNFKRLHNIMD
ncbi:MAG: hypothetical protein HDS42_00880 [Bacteroides sp.]|nr:hypothetical protein [Bacteroides sp.]